MSSPITDDEFKTYMFLKKAGFEWIEMCGREVMIIPLKNFGYLPVDTAIIQEHQKWVMVVEKSGRTWIWDSYIMEA